MPGYTDGLTLYVSAETQDEAVAADLLDIEFPSAGEVLDFGLLITETGTGAAPVVALDLSSSVAEADRTEVATITPSTTAAAGSRTRSSAVDANGRPKFPVNVPHGGRVTLEHKTAGAAAGAYKAYAVVKHTGGVAIGTTASPVAEATS